MIQIDLPIEMSREISGNLKVDICKLRLFHNIHKIQIDRWLIALNDIHCTHQESNSIHFMLPAINLKSKIKSHTSSHIISHTSLHLVKDRL